MPAVDKPDEEWIVELVLPNTQCPHLFFPRNVHGCKLLRNVMDDDRCAKENCMMSMDVAQGKEIIRVQKQALRMMRKVETP